MITLFACPRGFTDEHITLIQTKAIQSWLLLEPRPQIILLGNEKGIREICQEYNIEHIPDIETSPYGTPLLNSIFQRAAQSAQNDLLAYVNADIILTQRIYDAASIIRQKWGNFLIVSAPFIADYDHLTIKTGFEKEISIKKHPIISGADLFIFPISTYHRIYEDIPKFRIGRLAWDNWLMAKAILNHIPTIDATSYAIIFHPNYSKSTHITSVSEIDDRAYFQEEIIFNLAIVTDYYNVIRPEIPYYLDEEGVIKTRLFGGYTTRWLLQHWKRIKYETAPLRYKLGLYRWWKPAPWREEIRRRRSQKS